MSLLVKKPGILTSVQDLGRIGHRGLGINPNGAMDRAAIRIINTLLGNPEYEAALELHLPAGEYVFEKKCSIAIGGADFGATLNGSELQNWRVTNASAGDVLKFTELGSGSRAYLAVAGGFSVDEWLGSKSTNLAAAAGGLDGRSLRSGDRIAFTEPGIVRNASLGPSLIPRYSRFPTVRIIAGAEFYNLTAISERDLVSAAFNITNDANRMGFRIAGPQLYLLNELELVSAAVTFGTIQLLPNGQLVILMADHQTTGGYPRIGTVIEADLPLVAQLGPGDGVSFKLVSLEEAEKARARFERELRFLRMGLELAPLKYLKFH